LNTRFNSLAQPKRIGRPCSGGSRLSVAAGVAVNNLVSFDTCGTTFERHFAFGASTPAGEITIEGKRGLDTFPSTNLDFILRSKGIQTVVLAGFLTNCCVESTMRSAYERGFDVVTLVDCTATVSQEAQDGAIAHDFGMFSRPLQHTEFLAELSTASLKAA
jgi:isochorismate hydrolase